SLGPADTAARDGRIGWLRSPCLGLCEQAPAAMFTIAGERPVRATAAPIDAAGIVARLEASAAPAVPPSSATEAEDSPLAGVRASARASVPQMGEPQLQLLRRVGMVDPASLDDYVAHRGYLALRQALEMGAEAVIREVTDSK